MQCRLSSSILAFYPLDVSSIPHPPLVFPIQSPLLVIVVKNICRYWEISFWVMKSIEVVWSVIKTYLCVQFSWPSGTSTNLRDPILPFSLIRKPKPEKRKWVFKWEIFEAQYFIAHILKGILMVESLLFLFYEWRTKQQILPKNSQWLRCLIKTRVQIPSFSLIQITLSIF